MNDFQKLENQITEINGKLNLLLAGLPALQIQPCKYTLYSWLEEWFHTYKENELKPNSLLQIKICINKHIKKNLPNKPLNEYSAFEIQKGLNKIQSTRMRKYTYDTLGAALRQAYKLDIIPNDIMSKTDNIKHKRKIGKALTLDEQKHFIEILHDNKLKPLYQFYLLSGCRKSEALTVKWSNVDYANKTIFISGTKTENAIRYIPLFPQTENLLNAIPRESEYIFPYSDNLVKCNFKRLKEKYNLRFRIHDLRHTFATRCLEKNISINTVQRWLGHAQASTTANIYTHVQREFELEEIKKFDLKL